MSDPSYGANPLPSGIRQAWSLIKSQTRHVLNGGRFLPLPQVEERLRMCAACEWRAHDRCAACGCYLHQVPDDAPVMAGQPGKAFRPTESCPHGRWPPAGRGMEMTPDEIARALESTSVIDELCEALRRCVESAGLTIDPREPWRWASTGGCCSEKWDREQLLMVWVRRVDSGQSTDPERELRELMR